MQLHVTQANNYSSKKDGSKLIDKNGKPYFRSVIKTQEYGSQFLSGFVYRQLQENQTIEAEVNEEMYNGTPQLKFKIASQKNREHQEVTEKLDTIIAGIVILRNLMETLAKPPQDSHLTKDDMPFAEQPFVDEE